MSGRLDALGSDGGTILGNSPRIAELRRLLVRVAATDATVLIAGESGTGKELVARAIHGQSARRTGPFLAVNCGAIAGGVLDSELFGHVRGAFTGAVAARRGLLRDARDGTILLDEIASTGPPFQVKLLRFIEGGEVRAVGAPRMERVSVRVIAATNIDLREAVRRGRFRDDLYHRLNVVALSLPPLRERGEDVALLAAHFAQQAAAMLGRPAPRLSDALLEALRAYSWPGNVRELRNRIEQAVLLADGDRVEVDDLSEALGGYAPGGPGHPLSYAQAKRAALGQFQREYVAAILRAAQGNVSQAAKLAGIPRQTVHRLIREARAQRNREN